MITTPGPHGISPRGVPVSAHVQHSEIDALGLGLFPQMMMMITTTIPSITLFLAVTVWLWFGALIQQSPVF